mmetsp:Transcript_112680/g.218347  ORF Transcript_112680/g.218347 Transcript_112680/m.218347 type:complete len:621 (+) Transcript_112680:72-1934(+)
MPPPCGQCGQLSSSGAFGDPGSEFEGRWFCNLCWQSWASHGVAANVRYSGASAFNGRQAFSWGQPSVNACARERFQKRETAAASPSKAEQSPSGEDEVLLTSRQAFEILAAKCPVFVEPDLSSRKIATKSKGGYVWGGELTVDGWLKLHGERGWILTDMRGNDGVKEVVRLHANETTQVAIGGYHSQGICCLEVCCDQAHVRQAPSHESAVMSARYQGELVFARSQSFNGWVRLAGEHGWMLVGAEDLGQLLSPLCNMPHVDLWLLRDVWAAARSASGDMDSKTSGFLKDAEAKARLSSVQKLGQLEYVEENKCWRSSENADQNLVNDGNLAQDDLQLSQAGILRKLFASAFQDALREEPLRGLVPEIRPCDRPVLLPVQEADEELPEETLQGPLGPAMLLEHGGTVYLADASGLLFEPVTQRLVGVWNPDARMVEAPPTGLDPSGGMTMVEHDGGEYLMTADLSVFNPKTWKRVGRFDPETNSIMETPPEEVSLRMAWDRPSPSSVGASISDLDGPSDPLEQVCLERAEGYFARKSYRVAAREFTKALERCAGASCVDLEEEVAILHRRAACFKQLREYQKLLEDAERLLKLNPSDSEASGLQQLASTELARRQALQRR